MTASRRSRQFVEARPDIALLDVNMPGLTGFQIIEQMRGEADLKQIPAMLITADSAGPSAQTGLAVGADDYVRKPFHIGELKQRVLALTQRSRDPSRADVVAACGRAARRHSRPQRSARCGAQPALPGRPGRRRLHRRDPEPAWPGDRDRRRRRGTRHRCGSARRLQPGRARDQRRVLRQPGLLLSLADWTLAQRREADHDPALVTATCLVLDPATGSVRWASAGHPGTGLLRRPAGRERRRGRSPAGHRPQAVYFPVRSRTMKAGERVLLFTDGLMRATFGRSDFSEAVLPWLVVQGSDLPLENLVEEIHTSYQSFLSAGPRTTVGLLLLEMPSRPRPTDQPAFSRPAPGRWSRWRCAGRDIAVSRRCRRSARHDDGARARQHRHEQAAHREHHQQLDGALRLAVLLQRRRHDGGLDSEAPSHHNQPDQGKVPSVSCAHG